MTYSAEAFTLLTESQGADAGDFAADVRQGLTSSPKRLSCRFFYDAEGSRLFDAICELPEYYLTRAEREILETHAHEIVASVSEGATLVELGSGSAEKTQVLIQAMLHRRASLLFAPIDISRSALEESAVALLDVYPDLEMLAVAGDYRAGLTRLKKEIEGPKLILWLGSSVGNFTRGAAAQFLNDLRKMMAATDRLLLGIDLRKDRAILEAAYDDAQGVTARFNKNLLARINRELGGHFDLDTFTHQAVYNEEAGRVEIYLVSDCDQLVTIDALGMDVPFEAGEKIFTEASHKFSLAEIDVLAQQAGFEIENQWFDGKKRFGLNLLRSLGAD